MANTIIQLKHSTVQGNIPVSLANGELSINTYDGKLYYADPTGTVQEFSEFSGPAGLNGEIQFNDSGVLGANSGLTYSKTSRVLTVVGGAIIGGINVAPQIQFSYNHANAAFDYANTISGGAAIDNVARSLSNTAQIHANFAFNHANSAYIQANTNATNITIIQGVNLTQNTNISNIEGVNLTQNNSITAAFIAANSAGVYANGAFARANNSLNANTGGEVTANITISANLTASNVATQTYIQFGDGSKQYTANAGSGASSGVTIVLDTFTGTGACTTFTLTTTPTSENYTIVTINGVTQAKTTYSLSGASLVFSEAPPNSAEVEVLSFSTPGTSGLLAYNQEFVGTGACTVFGLTNSPTSENYTIVSIDGVIQHKSTYGVSGGDITFSEAPVNGSTIDVTYFVASTLLDSELTIYAANHANAAFIAANNATDTYVRNHANAAFHQANAAYIQANTNATNITIIQGVNLTQNTNITNAQNTADAAFLAANNATDTYVRNHANSAFHQANAAYAQANTNATNITVIQGVNLTQNTNISDIQAVNLTQNTNITNAQNSASAAFIRANNSLNANVGGVITGPVTVAANLTITGNLTIIGNTITANIETLNIADPLIYLASNNYSGDAVEIGFAGNYYDGTTQRHTGVYREASNKEFYVFDNYTPEPTGNLIDINDASFRVATLNANLKSSLITLNNQNLSAYVNSAFNTANAAFTVANSAFTSANGTIAWNTANAAFVRANNSINANVGGTITGNTTIVGNLFITNTTTSVSNTTGALRISGGVGVTGNIHADAIFDGGVEVIQFANNAFHQANAAFTTANSAGKTIILFSDSPPAGPTNNTLWWQSNTGVLKVYYTDADGAQWVDASPVAPTSSLLISDDTTSAVTIYPIFTSNTTGALSNVSVSSTKLTYNPSTGTVTAVDFNSTSDLRRKENVQLIENGLEIIQQIDPVSFNWKETSKQGFGVIAQQIETILPSIVGEDGEGYKSISYTQLISFLISAVKEQQKQIDDLKRKIDGN